MALCKRITRFRTALRPNPRMDLTVTVAAQRVLRPRCLLLVPAAHAHVERSRLSAAGHVATSDVVVVAGEDARHGRRGAPYAGARTPERARASAWESS